MNNPLPIPPILHPLDAAVQVPGSKSLTNRALLLAALAEGQTTLSNALFSDDSRYFAGALTSLGFKVVCRADRAEMLVEGLGGVVPSRQAELFIGNAGTAARFLTAFLTLGRGDYVLDGDARMRKRPIGDLIAALEPLGASLEPGPKRCPPVRIKASGLRGGKTAVAGNISSQFLSALLMVAPYAAQPVEIQVTTELNSRPYIDMTLAVMRDFSVDVERDGYQTFKISPARYRSPGLYPVESDASAASYFFAAPAACGGQVSVENITRSSLQGDIAFLGVLESMGCRVVEKDRRVTVVGPGEGRLAGIDADMRDFSDTAQTLAAIAPFASSPTRIRGIASSRVKETDRVRAVCSELARLGVEVEEHPDGMTIQPCARIQPAVVRTYEDHRMAMAFSLVGLRANGIAIENPGCVAKTFPNFFDVLEQLRQDQP